MHKSLTIFILLASFFTNYLSSEEMYDAFLDQEIEQLSFYMGYLIGRDHAKNSYGFPTKFEKIIEGMKAGIAGETVPGKEDLIPLIKRMQKTIVEKQTALNLQEAENYLKDMTKNPSNLIMIEPSKLFYSIDKQGDGQVIRDHPWLHFKMSELRNGELHLLYSTYDDK